MFYAAFLLFFPFKFMYGRSRKKLTLRPHNNKDNAGVIKVDTNSFASFILTFTNRANMYSIGINK